MNEHNDDVDYSVLPVAPDLKHYRYRPIVESYAGDGIVLYASDYPTWDLLRIATYTPTGRLTIVAFLISLLVSLFVMWNMVIINGGVLAAILAMPTNWMVLAVPFVLYLLAVGEGERIVSIRTRMGAKRYIANLLGGEDIRQYESAMILKMRCEQLNEDGDE